MPLAVSLLFVPAMSTSAPALSAALAQSDKPAPGITRDKRTGMFFGAMSGLLSGILLDQLGTLDLLPMLRRESLWTILILALLGAWLGAGRARRVLHGVTSTVFGLWLVVSLSPLADGLVRSIYIESPPEAADAVVVLGSYIQPDNDFSNTALTRLTRGLELVRESYAPRLVLPEIKPPAGSYATATNALAERLDIPITVETVGPVSNTHDEAMLISALARQRGWKKILLVTSPTHIRRAAATFRKTGLIVVPTPSRETSYNAEAPHTADERRRAFGDAVREIVGLWMYQRRGWA